MTNFKIHSDFTLSEDQAHAVEVLTSKYETCNQQVLLGGTGTGKTFTMANIIQKLNKKTLILAPNKTLAGQLYAEFKEFFPENRVEYFISNFDYYRPEAYNVSTDTFIEKDSKSNLEIDVLRHSATASLLERDDVIVIASVSCIYGIGSPEEYAKGLFVIREGDMLSPKDIIYKLIEMQYVRNDVELIPGSFRSKGDVIEVKPMYMEDEHIRIDMFGEEIESIKIYNSLEAKVVSKLKMCQFFPATHYYTNENSMREIVNRIEKEYNERLEYFQKNNRLLEAERLKLRITHDMEMLLETGSTPGVENYSLYLTGRNPGDSPYTLMDFFGNDFLMILDESHLGIPQVGAMYKGDASRKQSLVDYGFRLPSAKDNRPLTFEEFENKLDKVLYVSATPGNYELDHKFPIVEQIIRPTGLLDPTTEIRPKMGQIDDLLFEITERAKSNERTLVTTITKRMAEEITNFLKEKNIKVAYLHSDINSLERLSIINALRRGKYDCLIGINLLREGLDMPEVSLVAILDADKDGFLRNYRSFIQTIGRAARNEHGHVIMYADRVTESMEKAIEETKRRREIQHAYNIEHNITPKTIIKEIRDDIKTIEDAFEAKQKSFKKMNKKEKEDLLSDIEKQMKEAAANLDFEKAAELRDIFLELKN